MSDDQSWGATDAVIALILVGVIGAMVFGIFPL